MISLFLPALVYSNIPQPNFSILIIKITLDVQPIQLYGQRTSVSGHVFLTWSDTFQENSQDNPVINKVQPFPLTIQYLTTPGKNMDRRISSVTSLISSSGKEAKLLAFIFFLFPLRFKKLSKAIKNLSFVAQ